MNKKQETLSWREIYGLVDDKVSGIDEKMDRIEIKVDNVVSKVANIEGRLMIIPILISSGISIFFFIINLVVKK